MGKIVVVTGGRRSGKSRFAEGLVLGLSSSPVYVASGVAVDEEFAMRIERHKRERDMRFRTIEEPIRIREVVGGLVPSQVILWECATTWLANVFHGRGWVLGEEDERGVYDEIEAICEVVVSGRHTLVVVTNEIGMGVVPVDAVSRRYSDVLGRCNQQVARVADEVYFVVSGIPWRVK